MLAAVHPIDRCDLFAARQLARARATADHAMGEQAVDHAVGVRLDRGREEQEILAPREVPVRDGGAQEKALKVMRVKVSFTPRKVWMLLVTK